MVVCPPTCRPCKKNSITFSPHRSCCTNCSWLQGLGNGQWSSIWALPRVFGSGSSRAGVFPGKCEQQCVVLACNALSCFFFFFFFGLSLRCLGPQVGPTHRPPVVAGHASLWPRRQPLLSVPGTCRSHKGHHIEFSPPLPLAHPRSARSPIA